MSVAHATVSPYRRMIVHTEDAFDWDGFMAFPGEDTFRYICSRRTKDEVAHELEKVAYEDAKHTGRHMRVVEAEMEMDTIEVATGNPLIPFGVNRGPNPDLSTVQPSDIARAATALIDHYDDKQAVVSRALSGYDLALYALEDQFLPLEARRVHVREDDTMKVTGSKIYSVSADGCTCKDFTLLVYGKKYAGSGAEGGMCKHCLAREILRLAQARQGAVTTEGNKTAYTSLQCGQLVRALKAMLKDNPAAITLEIVFYRVRLFHDTNASHAKELKSTDQQGWGIRALTIQHNNVVTVINALAGVDKAQDVNLMIDSEAMEVSFFGHGIGLSVEGI